MSEHANGLRTLEELLIKLHRMVRTKEEVELERDVLKKWQYKNNLVLNKKTNISGFKSFIKKEETRINQEKRFLESFKIGETVGQLRIIKFIKKLSFKGKLMLSCKCSCGSVITISTTYILENKKVNHNCGCIAVDKRSLGEIILENRELEEQLTLTGVGVINETTKDYLKTEEQLKLRIYENNLKINQLREEKEQRVLDLRKRLENGTALWR
jgi:hypothetical protein